MKDESSPAYEAYKKIEKITRPHEISLSDYVLKLEQLHKVAESHKMEVLDGVLAYRLLNNANLQPSALVLNMKKYTCQFFFQHDLLLLTSSVGPPKVVAYQLNPWFQFFTCFLLSSIP